MISPRYSYVILVNTKQNKLGRSIWEHAVHVSLAPSSTSQVVNLCPHLFDHRLSDLRAAGLLSRSFSAAQKTAKEGPLFLWPVVIDCTVSLSDVTHPGM